MKIEILTGSPRRNGNTAILARLLKEKLKKEGHTINITSLYDFKIKPCIDCRGCKKDKLICSLDDDMPEIYRKLDASDIIVIGTPIYWYGPSAMTKLLIDRLRPYFVNRILEGKKGALLLPAGDGEKDTGLTVLMLKKTFETLGMIYMGCVTAKAYDAGEVSKDKVVIRSLDKLAGLIN